MPSPTRRDLVLYALGLLAVALLGWRWLQRDDAATGGERAAARAAGTPVAVATVAAADAEGGGRLTVHVAGAVRRPGVYELAEGARVQDAVERAGGALPRAELSALNLAAKVQDGRQVLVPRRRGRSGAAAGGGSGAGGADTTTAGTGRAAVGSTDPAAAEPIDLNTATPEQLDTLDGVGPVTVEKIVGYRTEHGGFGSIEELAQVPGIGPKRLAALRDRVRV